MLKCEFVKNSICIAEIYVTCVTLIQLIDLRRLFYMQLVTGLPAQIHPLSHVSIFHGSI